MKLPYICEHCMRFHPVRLMPVIPPVSRPRIEHTIESDKGFGALIRKRRREAGLSQEMLASISGVPQPNLSKIENGRMSPTLATYMTLCKDLGIDLVGVPREVDVPPEYRRHKRRDYMLE